MLIYEAPKLLRMIIEAERSGKEDEAETARKDLSKLLAHTEKSDYIDDF